MLKNHQRFWQRIGSNSVIEPSSFAKSTIETSLGKRGYMGKGRGSKDSLSRFLHVYLTPNFGMKFLLRGEVCNIPERRTTPG
jgi:hypothetical protein